jgi:hypothetical protein
MLRGIVTIIDINPAIGNPKFMSSVVVLVVHPNVRHGFVHFRTALDEWPEVIFF